MMRTEPGEPPSLEESDVKSIMLDERRAELLLLVVLALTSSCPANPCLQAETRSIVGGAG